MCQTEQSSSVQNQRRTIPKCTPLSLPTIKIEQMAKSFQPRHCVVCSFIPSLLSKSIHQSHCSQKSITTILWNQTRGHMWRKWSTFSRQEVCINSASFFPERYRILQRSLSRKALHMQPWLFDTLSPPSLQISPPPTPMLPYAQRKRVRANNA